ncbi:hypothetical protein GLI01_08120 [Gluconacetobacter liquefaciens]|uniref:6-phosphogluconolactonase (Cycloisomerase 2 family) n=1 Tax=Gluconacetobacter liquefaciens TaxID=89584 RepID=A0A370G2R9_GLULI|nr:hypothetical protein [Gluconacetobacter liquefaciens]MBB2186500.1 hypothetical protein [Gluconacetobacter liquefaciens]RDI38167.1 6-phosphogluconolactonase (cycloisomerase 2 family) [Gluconacetobacter liquefaciens]GEB36777.1 hypothetical protein GLI01_08120 [Gluconacetobacter liquefaciens]
MRNKLTLAFTALLAMSSPVCAQTVVSANDGHSILQNGVQVLPKPLVPDTLSVLERAANGVWGVRASLNVPVSVIGPPTALEFTHDGKTVLVSSASKPDVKTNKIVPDDRISVVDLSGAKPRLVQQVASAAGATTMRFTPDGQHLLVANGKSGVLTWFRFDGHRLGDRKVITLPVSGFPAGIAILPDGKRALVSLWQADRVYLLHIDGDAISVDPTPLNIAPGPWNIRMTKDGHYAVMGMLGHGEGLPGALSVLDLTASPIREVQRVTVPNAPEGLDISPDGQYVAVVSQNGSAVPPTSPRYHPRGVVTVLSLKDGQLHTLAQAPGTLWPQGLAFAPDGKEILVQGVMDRSLLTLGWDGEKLERVGEAPLPGGGADLARSSAAE